MPVEYQFQDPQGNNHSQTTPEIQEFAQQRGLPVVGRSDAGQRLIMRYDDGEYEVPVKNVLESYGHKVVSANPLTVSDDSPSAYLRAMVNELPDDDTRKAFLESKMRKEGHENPSILGSGRDWYHFDPTTSSYTPLTNIKGQWGLGDVAEGASDLVHGVGSGIGAAIGGTGGFFGTGTGPVGGAIGGALGSAEGGMIARMGTKGIAAAIDPEFRDAADLEAHGKDLALHTPGDAIAGALPGVMKAFGGKAVGSAVDLASPVSSTAATLGGGMEKAGKGLAKVAGWADTPMARDLMKTAALPKVKIATEGAQALDYLANDLGPRVASKIAQPLTEASEWKLLEHAPWLKEGLQNMAAGAGRFARGQGNFAQSVRQGAEKLGNLATGADKAMDAAISVPVKAAKNTGNVGSGVFGAMKRVGELGQKGEATAYARKALQGAGLDEFLQGKYGQYDPEKRWAEEQYRKVFPSNKGVTGEW